MDGIWKNIFLKNVLNKYRFFKIWIKFKMIWSLTVKFWIKFLQVDHFQANVTNLGQHKIFLHKKWKFLVSNKHKMKFQPQRLISGKDAVTLDFGIEFKRIFAWKGKNESIDRPWEMISNKKRTKTIQKCK